MMLNRKNRCKKVKSQMSNFVDSSLKIYLNRYWINSQIFITCRWLSGFCFQNPKNSPLLSPLLKHPIQVSKVTIFSEIELILPQGFETLMRERGSLYLIQMYFMQTVLWYSSLLLGHPKILGVSIFKPNWTLAQNLLVYNFFQPIIWLWTTSTPPWRLPK